MTTNTKELCDAMATNIARYENYRCWPFKQPSSSGLSGMLKQQPGFHAELVLRPAQTFKKISEYLSERSSQQWKAKPQFWYPPPRFGSQHLIPKPLFVLIIWAYTAVFGFSARGQIFLLRHLSPQLWSQHQLNPTVMKSLGYFLLAEDSRCLQFCPAIALLWKSFVRPVQRISFGHSHFPQTILPNHRTGRFCRNFTESDKKKEPKPKLLGPDIFRSGGGLPREGVGTKKFDMSLETREIKLFWRDIPGFAGISGGRPQSLRRKKFVFNSCYLQKPEFWNSSGPSRFQDCRVPISAFWEQM